jgi:dTMP kinase
MLVAIEGPAGAGKSALRDHLLRRARTMSVRFTHVGQFSWLSLPATRTIIRFRAGGAGLNEAQAVAAVAADLRLHDRHTITLARTVGHVIADRLQLSTACLLSLIYGGDPATYLGKLAANDDAHPDLLVLLTTPPDVCTARLQQRVTAPRFGEDPQNAIRLSQLYDRGAQVWSQTTGLATIREPSRSPADVQRLAEAVLDRVLAREAGA